MNTRNAPLSPVSVGGSEWSAISKYQNGDGPYPTNRGLISPPNSGGSNSMMNGFPGGPRSVGGPSPPPSVGRSSTYARSESGRSIRGEDNTEAVLGEHYIALKRYLSSTSKDGRANPPPNKARDKLLRLSAVQFLELSTDVFDELLRRQAFSRRPPNAPPNVGPPNYLLPADNFHPKRNQARQKLSTLGPPRFRDLATDVFCELERRIPRFIAGEVPRMSQMSQMGGPPSRAGTPVSSMNGPRGPNRMRRPSDASSIRSGAPRITGDYPPPPSPGLQNGNFDRPQPRTFQSNTIVPNKSTMLEEDDDGVSSNNEDNDTFGLDNLASKRRTDASTGASETDKKLIDDYQNQVRELRDKLDSMEDQMKKKEDELNNVMDGERSRATASNAEKKEWDGLRTDLESKLAEAQNLNDSMRDDLDRMRDDHAMECRQLREDLEDAQQNTRGVGGDEGLMRENEELRFALQEQAQVTEGVRNEAQQFLQEMKALSQQHSPSWDRQAELEKMVEQLELEVRDWRSRYARTKTQLRNMRASSMGLTIDQDAAKYVREKGFTQDNGRVKDVHVTKFQIAIDELLRRARSDDPDKVIDSIKSVIVGVRRITKDIDDSQPSDEEAARHQQKLKSRVSATANNLITASKNFASAAGISPVSLLDAAASHLVASLVELLRTVKIRATPAGELEDDDDGTITPVDSTGFFSNRTTTTQQDAYAKPLDSPLVPPPTIQALRVGLQRDSANSSAYSPVSSPRESVDQYGSRRPMSRNGVNGANYMGLNKNLPGAPNGYGSNQMQNEDLKIYLEDQTAVMVQTIQGLVGSIRSDAPIEQIDGEIESIADVVGKVVAETEACGNGGDMLDRLSSCRQRLLEAGDHGKDLAARGLGENDREWRMWTQTLPPIAFEIVRETKELIQRIDRMVTSSAADDFS